MTGVRLPGVVMCRSLPPKMRIHLKKGVTEMSMYTCFMFDLALFLIFSVNIMYHDDNIFAMTELSLLGSCFLFGFLFEIAGRKKIFTMRLLITSLASAFVPFYKLIDFWIIPVLPIQSLAFVMCSVSLTVPVISDFVKYRRRGVAYGYMGLILAISMFSIMTIDKFVEIKEGY
jgi:MFS family permease